MPDAESHAVWNFVDDAGTKQHSVDSFGNTDVKTYVPSSSHNKLGESKVEEKPKEKN